MYVAQQNLSAARRSETQQWRNYSSS
jgi:hypothetical protein